MRTIYDVAVIGGGPGGLASAHDCARYGLQTVVFEEDKEAGEPVHCGECLSQFALKNTGFNPPDTLIAARVKGVCVNFPNGCRRHVIEPGYVLYKERFEQWLAAEANNRGAEMKFSSPVTGIRRSNGGYWVIKVAGSNYMSRLLIDASGTRSVCSTILKLNNVHQSMVGIQYQLAIPEPTEFLEFYLSPDLAPGGYLWVIPKGNGMANIGLITESPKTAKQNLNRFLHRIGLSGRKPIKTFGGVVAASGPYPRTSSHGVMLVGDAGGFTSPLFEGGTHLALKSGQFAAKVAKIAIDKNDVGSRVLGRFERLWKKAFPNYRHIIRGRSALYHLPEADLNRIADFMPGKINTASLRQRINIGIDVLKNEPRLLVNGFRPIMKAFEYSRAEYYGW